MIGWIVAGGAGAGAAWLYNRMVTRRARVEAAWAQIDVQLKRRADLVPQLVEAVRGAMRHEAGTLEAVTAARAACAGARDDPARRFAAEARLSAALAPLMMVAEANPDLKTSSNVLMLQEELASTENRIAMARQHFNDCVAEYNTAIGSFPGNLLAQTFRFTPRTPYDADPSVEAVPQVRLGPGPG